MAQRVEKCERCGISIVFEGDEARLKELAGPFRCQRCDPGFASLRDNAYRGEWGVNSAVFRRRES